jgi:adenylate kinase family enzyme
MPRISVIGTSGSGKTTLARQLATQLSIPHIELDALNWDPNWTQAPTPVFRQRVTAAIAADHWTACGNYGAVRDLVMARADTIIFLDYSMSLVARRILRRTLLRCLSGEELWNGNRERFLVQLFSRDSLLLWVWNSWRRHRRDYPKMLRKQQQLGKRILRFRHPGETQRWLRHLQRL